MRFIFNLHSTFNVLFNIQLSIQHSTIHFEFNSSFTHSIIYSIISTSYSTFNYSFNIQLFIQYSTIHSTFNYSFQFIKSFESSLLLVSDAYHCLLKTWRRWLGCPGGGVLPFVGYLGMCRCEGYGFQVVYSRIGYINQSVWV